jgi:hypothetical protein
MKPYLEFSGSALLYIIFLALLSSSVQGFLSSDETTVSN